MPCKHCENNSSIYTYDCFGCVVRNTLNLPIENMLGFMTTAATAGKHDLEKLKAEVKAKILEKRKK